MSDLALQKCHLHLVREAVARCPSCRRFFCRECVTEHAGRMMCVSCLDNTIETEAASGSRLGGIVNMAQLLVAILLSWLFFALLGQGLLNVPSTFHEDTIFSTSDSGY
ncbi:MAG: rhomboid family protein [Candidatus Hydrogenedentes bacterium]|nr:rhomboid family protein [Candidatus Hydrogenedentota bacterium]